MGNSKSTAREHQPEDDVTTGLTSGRSDAEHNASIIPVAEIVDNVYTTESVLTSGINVGDYNANFIPLHANIHDIYTTGAGREPSNDGIPSYSENNKDGMTKLRGDTQDDKTSEQHATVAVCNEEKNIGETREQFNA
ncbi:uncharacterized protein [Triticum aestivum]|uniref:uncharacterized protein n=1 Tax=Triticum aestivum TaxID=4565 RepID=UPI001D00F26D|nr:uncharacterized protein LOC123101345 [Triticum aestivum]